MKILFLLVGFCLIAPFSMAETTGAGYRSGVVEQVGVKPTVEIPENVPVPTKRPEVRPAQPRDWSGGQPAADFSRVSRSVTSAPIWPKFTDVFSKCAPGCAPVRVGTYGARGGRSCHPSGNAVDLGGLKCGGTNYSAYTGRFVEFVNCVKGQSYGGKKWKTLFRETHKGRSRDCSTNNRNQTACHWDHVHMSLGCAAASI